MKRGKFFLLSILCLALALTAACTPGAEEQRGAQGDGEANLRFLHIWPEHSAAMENIIRGIEAQNEGLHVDVDCVEWAELEHTLSTAYASDSMYDVFFMFASQVGSMQKQGRLLQLDEYMDKDWAGRFEDGALDEYRVDGELYGLPYRGSGVVVIYNRDLFKRMGWRTPDSMEEFSALMQLALAEGYVPLSAAGKPDGFELDSLRSIVTNYISLDAGLLDDPDRLTDRKTDWQGELAAGAQTVKNWANKGYFGSNPLTVDQAASMDRFLSGKAAMLLCNTNELYQLRTQSTYMPFELGSFLIPGIKGGDTLLFTGACYQDGFAVWSETEQAEQAVALLKGLTGPEAAAQWAQDTLSVMATKDVALEDELLREFSGYFTIAGRYCVVPDYALGDSNSLKDQLFVDFMTSDMTADTYEKNYETITRNAIAAAER